MANVEGAFLFADLSGFTALTECHGDADAAGVALRFAEMARGRLDAGARLVKTIGDEVMVFAPDAVSAVRSALAIYRAVETEPNFPTIRVGLHFGTAFEQAGDYYGGAVNLAARVASHARSGQILCTEALVAAAKGLAQVEFHPSGLGHFKNLRTPVPLFEISGGGARTTPPDIDPVCRMRVDPEKAPARLSYGVATYHFCALDCAKTFLANPEQYARK